MNKSLNNEQLMCQYNLPCGYFSVSGYFCTDICAELGAYFADFLQMASALTHGGGAFFSMKFCPAREFVTILMKSRHEGELKVRRIDECYQFL